MSNIDDQTDPINYDKNLLEIDKKWALDKHIARMNFINSYTQIYGKNLKFLEISSYRGWGLEYSKNDIDVYGIEAHQQSVDFSKIKFKDLASKIHYNLFELFKYFCHSPEPRKFKYCF